MAAMENKPPTAHLEYHRKGPPGPLSLLTPPALTPEEEARAWRKIDIRLMPILASLYLFSFLDRGASCGFQIFGLHLTITAGNIGWDSSVFARLRVD